MRHASTSLLFVTLGIIAAAMPARPARGQTLPPEVASLGELIVQKDRLIQGLHRFTAEQYNMLRWDEALREFYTEENDTILAALKTEEMDRRVNVVQSAWQFVLRYYPSDSALNNAYGEFLYDLKQSPMAALKHWRTAAALDDKNAAVQNNLAMHYFRTGDITRGMHHMGNAIDLEPENADYLYNLSQMYIHYAPKVAVYLKKTEANVYEHAMRMSYKAAQLAPDDFEILQDYATNYFAADHFGIVPNWNHAVDAWRAARAKAPTDEDRYYTYLNEGRALIAAGRPAEAATALEEARTLRPDAAAPQELLDELQSAAGGSPAA